jgi:hypothetical protein
MRQMTWNWVIRRPTPPHKFATQAPEPVPDLIAWCEEREWQGCRTCRLEHLIWSAAGRILGRVVLLGPFEGSVANSVLCQIDPQSVRALNLAPWTQWIYSLQWQAFGRPDAYQSDGSLTGDGMPDLILPGQTTHERQRFDCSGGKPEAFFGYRSRNHPQALVSPQAVITTTLARRKE